MLDKYLVPLGKAPLRKVAAGLSRRGVTANQVSLAGFVFGLLAVVAVATGHTGWALMLLLLNRLGDGIDGELARLNGATDAGAFLDISLDFVFYAVFPLGFALLDPVANALPAAVLIASFVGTGASFLAFSAQAQRHEIAHPDFAYKGFYYLDGLAEGSETIICFALMCLLPTAFSTIAWVFAAICAITAINRIYFGFTSLRAMRRLDD